MARLLVVRVQQRRMRVHVIQVARLFDMGLLPLRSLRCGDERRRGRFDLGCRAAHPREAEDTSARGRGLGARRSLFRPTDFGQGRTVRRERVALDEAGAADTRGVGESEVIIANQR